jgi:cytochrome P450
MWHVSDNWDEEAIDAPDQCNIQRTKPQRYLAFGVGIHRCAGNRLAEQQLQILWKEILKRNLQF